MKTHIDQAVREQIAWKKTKTGAYGRAKLVVSPEYRVRRDDGGYMLTKMSEGERDWESGPFDAIGTAKRYAETTLRETRPWNQPKKPARSKGAPPLKKGRTSAGHARLVPKQERLLRAAAQDAKERAAEGYSEAFSVKQVNALLREIGMTPAKKGVSVEARALLKKYGIKVKRGK